MSNICCRSQQQCGTFVAQSRRGHPVMTGMAVLSCKSKCLLWKQLICLLPRLVFLHNSFVFWADFCWREKTSLVAIRQDFICQIATLQSSPLHEILFALIPHSHWMTSSLLLIRLAIFGALDIYSANSVNTVFLQRPSLVWSKPELMAIAACTHCWFSCEILL